MRRKGITRSSSTAPKPAVRTFRFRLRGRALGTIAHLHGSGLYGETLDETAERVLCERLADIDREHRDRLAKGFRI